MVSPQLAWNVDEGGIKIGAGYHPQFLRVWKLRMEHHVCISYFGIVYDDVLMDKRNNYSYKNCFTVNILSCAAELGLTHIIQCPRVSFRIFYIISQSCSLSASYFLPIISFKFSSRHSQGNIKYSLFIFQHFSGESFEPEKSFNRGSDAEWQIRSIPREY